MFEKFKAMFGSKPNESKSEPAEVKPAGMAPMSSAAFEAPHRIEPPKPSRADISRANQQVHDELMRWAELWAAGRHMEVPEKYRSTFNQYLKHFIADDTANADRYYAAIAKERCIEILEGWGFPDPAKQ